MWPLIFKNICVDVKTNSLILVMIVVGHIIILHLSTDIYKKLTELSGEWLRKVFNRSLIGAFQAAYNSPKPDFGIPSKQRNPKSTQPQSVMPSDNVGKRNDQSREISPSKQPRKQKAPKSTNQIIAERLATNQMAENIVYELGEPSMMSGYTDPELAWKQGFLNRAYFNL